MDIDDAVVMHRNIIVAVAAFALAAPTGAQPAKSAAPPELVVAPAWLVAHLADKNLVLLHVGRPEEFRVWHIAGARPMSLDDISVSKHDGTGLMLELPPADDLRGRLEALGISNDSRIVVY